jgi:hypothetical protein
LSGLTCFYCHCILSSIISLTDMRKAPVDTALRAVGTGRAANVLVDTRVYKYIRRARVSIKRHWDCRTRINERGIFM